MYRKHIFHALLALIFLFLSAWRLSVSPATWFDEGINLGIAKSLADNGVFSLMTAPDTFVSERPYLITTNFPVIAPVALSLKIFGMNFAAARVPMVIFLWLFVLSAYALVRRWSGSAAALAAAALIITFAPFYGNGKVVLGEVPGLMFFISGIFVLPKETRYKRLFASGLLFGLCAATKPFFLLVIPAVAVGEAISNWPERAVFARRLAYIGLGMLAPMFLWFLIIFPRWSSVGPFSAFQYYGNSYADPDWKMRIGANLKRFATETTPVHFFLLLLASSVGWMRVWRKERQLPEGVAIVGVFALLTVAWYLKTPGWYRYFFPAHLLVFLLFAGSLWRVLPKKIALVITAALFLVQGSYLYTKRTDPVYIATEVQDMAAFAREHAKAGESILVINNPSLAFAISDRPVSQFLQINPSLYFGRNNFISVSGEPYRYVIITGKLEQTAFASTVNLFAASYTQVDSVGHMTFYRSRL